MIIYLVFIEYLNDDEESLMDPYEDDFAQRSVVYIVKKSVDKRSKTGVKYHRCYHNPVSCFGRNNIYEVIEE